MSKQEYIPPARQIPASFDSQENELTPSWQKPEDLAVKMFEASSIVDALARQHADVLQDVAKYHPSEGTRIQELSIKTLQAQALIALRAKLEFGLDIDNPEVQAHLAGIYHLEDEEEKKEAKHHFQPSQGVLMDMMDEMGHSTSPAEEMLRSGRSLDEEQILKVAATFNQHKPQTTAADLLKALAVGNITEGTRIGSAIQTISELEAHVSELLASDKDTDGKAKLSRSLSLILAALLENLKQDGIPIVRRLEEVADRFLQLGRTGLSGDFETILRDPSRVVDYSRELSIYYVIQWLLSHAQLDSYPDNTSNLPTVLLHNKEMTVNEKTAIRKMEIQLAVLDRQRQVLEEAVSDLSRHPGADPNHKAQVDQQIAETERLIRESAYWLAQYRGRSADNERIFEAVVKGHLSGKSTGSQIASVTGDRARSILTVGIESETQTREYSELPEMEYLQLLFGENLKTENERITYVPRWPPERVYTPGLPIGQFKVGLVNGKDSVVKFGAYDGENPLLDFRYDSEVGWKDISRMYPNMEKLIDALSRYYNWTHLLVTDSGDGGVIEGFDENTKITFHISPGFHSVYDKPNNAWRALERLAQIEEARPDYLERLYRWMKSEVDYPEYRKIAELAVGTPVQMLLLRNRYSLVHNWWSEYKSDLALVQDGWLIFVKRQHYPTNLTDHRPKLQEYLTYSNNGRRRIIHFKPELFHILPSSFTPFDWSPQGHLRTDIMIVPMSAEAKKIAGNKHNRTPKMYREILGRLYQRIISNKPPQPKTRGVILLPSSTEG